MRNTELLIPASSLEVLKTAVLYGADAVYIGGEMYGLRAKARNFSREDMEAGKKFAHENGVKVYVTANIVAHNEDLEGIREYFRELKEIGHSSFAIINTPGSEMISASGPISFNSLKYSRIPSKSSLCATILAVTYTFTPFS